MQTQNPLYIQTQHTNNVDYLHICSIKWPPPLMPIETNSQNYFSYKKKTFTWYFWIEIQLLNNIPYPQLIILAPKNFHVKIMKTAMKKRNVMILENVSTHVNYINVEHRLIAQSSLIILFVFVPNPWMETLIKNVFQIKPLFHPILQRPQQPKTPRNSLWPSITEQPAMSTERQLLKVR